jgi:uncharacterized protein (TIGR03437 family)
MRRIALALLWFSLVLQGQIPYTGTFVQITNSRANATQLWAITQRTLYRSDDQGKIFRPIVLPPLVATQPLLAQVLVDGRDSNLIWVATKSPDVPLLRSRDGGQSWSGVGTGLPSGLSPTGDFRISLHQTLEADAAIYLRLDSRVYKSTDQGTTFTLQSTLPMNGIFHLAPSDAKIMYAQTSAVTSSLAVSNDEGLSWRSAGNLSPGNVNLGILSSLPVILVHPRNPNQIFGSFFVTYADPNTPQGRSSTTAYYSSSDGGRSWTYLPLWSGFFNSMTVSADGSLLLVSGQNNARSTDFGANLTTLSTAGPFFINAANSSRVFTSRGLLSTDSGRSFAASAVTYVPLPARLPAVSLRLESGTSLELLAQPMDSEGLRLSFPPAAVRIGAPWLRLSFAEVSGSFFYYVSAKGLSPGDYESSIEVSSDGLLQPLVQTVQLRVSERIEPQLRYRYRRLAGNGSGQFSGDGGPALQAGFEGTIQGLAWQDGNLFVATQRRVRRINSANTIQSIAGGAEGGNGAGDGGPASAARFRWIGSLAAINRDLYITDWQDGRIRLIDAQGGIQTFFRSAPGSTPSSLGASARIRRSPGGEIYLNSSTGIFRWDGSAFVTALPNSTTILVEDFLFDAQGDFRIADRSRILQAKPRAVGTSGEAPRLIAGTPAIGFSGDHGPASSAQFNRIAGIAQEPGGALLILEEQRIRAILPNGVVQTVAGNGDALLSLVNGEVANAGGIGSVSCFTVDPQGRVYVGTYGGEVFVLERVTGVTPQVASGGVVSLAAGAPRIAPGAIFSIYGRELASGTESNSRLPLPGSIRGTQVLVNGVVAPLFFVSPGQINAQMPVSAGPGMAQLTVNRDGASSAVQSVEITSTQPDILTYGNNRAVAVNPSGTINSETQAARGGEVIVVYLTGIGALDRVVPTGAGSPASPLAQVASPASASVGGKEAGLLFLGLAPGFVGLAQANVQLPDELGSGDQGLILRVGGVDSNRALIRIE